MASVYVCFCTHTGEVELMARAIGDGIRMYGGTPILAYIPPIAERREQLKDDRLWQMVDERCRAEYKIAEATDLFEADAAAFGTPTVYASMAAEMKVFLDSLFEQVRDGELFNKPAATFTATHVGESGQELTSYTMWAPLSMLGFIMIGMPQTVPNLQTTYEQSMALGPDHRTHPRAPRMLTKTEWTLCNVIGGRLAIAAERMSEVAGNDVFLRSHMDNLAAATEGGQGGMP